MVATWKREHAVMAADWLIGAAALLGGWGSVTAAAWRFEHRLLFGQPDRLRSAPAGPFANQFVSRDVWLSAGHGTELRGVVTTPIHGRPEHTVLWFGGRGEDVRWTPALAEWLGPGFAVVSFAYRGHLGTRGRAGERLVVDDGLRALRWLDDEAALGHSRLTLFGRSLGTAVALQVAARLPTTVRLSGLALLSPMDSVRNLVWTHPLLSAHTWALRNPFDSLAAVSGAAGCPTLILLAEKDRTVPHARSHRLAAALEQHTTVSLQTIPGSDHRTLPRCTGALTAMASFARGL